MELKKVLKNFTNQETYGYGRDNKPEIEKKEITITETRVKLKRRKNCKAVRISIKSVERGASDCCA